MRAISIIDQLIAPPAFDDEQQTRVALLIHQITLGLAALAIVYVVVSTIFSYTALALVFGILVLSLCYLLNRLAYRGYIRSASFGLAFSLWLTFTLVAIYGQGFGVFDTSFSGYIIPIMVAGFLLGGRAGIFFALLSACSGLVILFAHSTMAPPPFSFSRSTAQWIGQSVLFIAAAYLLALTRRSLLDRSTALRREVAERQRVEKALRDQRERMILAMRAGGLESWVLDSRTLRLTYPDADPEDSASFPKDFDAFLKRVHPLDVETVRSTVEACLRDHSGFEIEYRYYSSDGELEWYYSKADVYNDSEGNYAGLYGLTYDITHRRNAEDAVRSSEMAARAFQEKLKALHEVSIELAQTATLDDLYRQAIIQGRDRLGFGRLGLFLVGDDPSVVVGTYGIDPQGHIRDERDVRFPLSNHGMMMEALNHRLHVSVRFDVELWDYSTVVGRGWNALALLWNETSAIGWLAADNLLTREPITEEQLELLSLYGAFLGPLILKKQAEMAAQRHQERLRLALKAAQMRAWEWNLLTNEIITDEPELFGLRTVTQAEEFYRQVYPPDQPSIQRALERAISENGVYMAEYRTVQANGRLRWVYSLGQVYRDESGQAAGITGVSQDITERKQAEERFYKAFHANPSAIAITTFDDGRYIEVNDAWLRLMGYTREETIGHTSIELNFIDSTETRQKLLNRFKEQGYLRNEELIAGGKDGRKIPILMLAEKIELDGQTCFLTMLQDISERKEAEKQALELALQTERVALLTDFMSNISHDIKTPLTAINTSLYLLERTEDTEKQRERLDVIRMQTRLLEKFIQDILTISRLDYAPSLEFRPVQLGGLLSEIEARLRPSVEQKNLSLTLELAQAPVMGDSGELDRALVNLVENAINYTPAGGSVNVRAYVHDGQAVIEVTDTGIGIAPADMNRIFTRFYRSEAAREASHTGTGLGLAIVQKIIEMHQGSIEVESVVGEGSVFRVRLPLSQPDAS